MSFELMTQSNEILPNLWLKRIFLYFSGSKEWKEMKDNVKVNPIRRIRQIWFLKDI